MFSNFTEGYTSISVREPLANIIAQTKAMNRLKKDLDPHYATVSDDSGKKIRRSSHSLDVSEPVTTVHESQSSRYCCCSR